MMEGAAEFFEQGSVFRGELVDGVEGFELGVGRGEMG